jgi:uncharacterized protein
MASHGPHPPEPVRVAVMRQRWECLTFLHWAYDVDVVQRLLPSGLEVEPWQGRAWVGLVPFRMEVAPPVGPVIRRFPETNVRTYVVGPGGRAGVYFFSLDAGSLAAVGAARASLRLRYHWARMAVDCGTEVSYRSEGRRSRHGNARPTASDVTIRPGELLDATTEFDHYLTARFTLWNRAAGRLLRVQVEHPPWRLRRSDLVQCRDDLVTAAGLPAPVGEPVLHFADGVDVRIGPPRLRRD